MAPIKRTSAMLDGAEDDDMSVMNGAAESSASSTRKRRRMSLEEFAEDDEPGSDPPRDEPESTPPFFHGSEDEAELEALATQIVRQKYLLRKENVAAECGVLEEVYVSHFMCHTNFKFELCPQINFICGRNGSGKSAILTAITLCLGGKASSTNRGQSLKDFVKEGFESARIYVKIKNQGEGAYMPEEYGKSIFAERWFTRSGASGFRIMSERSRVVTTKKSDLEEICDHFSLQIENPLNVLSQDMARAFITSSTAADKYKFFIKGVQLEQLDQDYCIIESNVDNIEVKIETKRPDVEIIKQKREKARQKLDLSNRHNGMVDKVQDYRRQLAWAHIITQENVRDHAIREVEEATSKIEAFENEVIRLDNAYEAADQEATTATEQYEEADQKIRKIDEEKREAKVLHDEVKKTVSDAQTDQRTIKTALMQTRDTITAKTEEIKQEEQRLADLTGGGANERLGSLEQAREAATDADKTHQQHQAGKQALEREVQNAKTALDEQHQQVEVKKQEVDDVQRKVDDLSRDRNNEHLAYHPNLPRLLKAIEQELRFAERPVGPIGKHIRLLRPQWSSVLEKSFGGTLNSFIVTSKSDMNVLRGLMAKVQCQQNIIIGNSRPLDTRPHEPHQELDTILRALVIDNDLVRKQLVIQHGIEQSLLIEDLHKASEVLYGPSRPRNVKRCFCIDQNRKMQGYHLSYTRAGRASQDPVPQYQGRARMKIDDGAQIQLRQEALQDVQAQLRQAENDFRAARDGYERAKQAVVRHGRQERDLRVAFQQAEDEVERLTEAIKEDSIESGKLEVLRTALSEAERELALNESSYEDAVVALDAKKEELKTARAGLAALDESTAEQQDVVKRLKVMAVKATQKRAIALNDKNNALAKINDAQTDRQSLMHERDKIEDSIKQWIVQARMISERVNIPEGETEGTLQKKYESLMQQYEKSQREIGASREQITADAARTAAAYKEALEQLRDLENLAMKLKGSLIERRERWRKFRSFISCRAKAQFTYLLSERSFRGQLITDHRQKLLELSVEPDITKKDGAGRGARTLSGGEKSYSQICLLLAIWEAMGSPIRCLDEFDVYMDAVNRNLSVGLLIGAARLSVGRQFVLISPGSKTDIPQAEDVKAQELEPPLRGDQMTIEETINR